MALSGLKSWINVFSVHWSSIITESTVEVVAGLWHYECHFPDSKKRLLNIYLYTYMYVHTYVIITILYVLDFKG